MIGYFKSIGGFKIIPVLVFVTVLAFSMRLVDVFRGINALSAQAYATEKKDMTEAQMQQQAEKAARYMPAAGDPEPEHAASEEEKNETKPVEKAGPYPEPIIEIEPQDKEAEVKKPRPFKPKTEWRSPIDQDIEFSAMRAELFEDLAERRQGIEDKERQLTTRESLLKAAEQELEQKYKELSQMRDEIKELLNQQSEEEKARIQSLVKIYEGMKAKDAANIFNTLDLDILVPVAAAMSERRLSPILAEMSPDRAKTVTIMLAEQVQLPEMPPSN